MKHLDGTAVLEAAEGRPSRDAANHLASCEACRARVEGTRRLLEGLSRAGSELRDPPEVLRRWAMAVSRNRRPAPRRRRTLRILHEGSPVPAAVRGAAEGTRSWLLGDESCHLDLRVVRTAAGTFVLRGHLLLLDGRDGMGWRVEVSAGPGVRRETFTDRWGELKVPDLPGGELSVVVEGDGERLEAHGLRME